MSMDLRDVLGEEAHRLEGLEGMDDVRHLGANNVGRLIALIRAAAIAAMSEGESAADLRVYRQAVDALTALPEQADKPWFPRLRNELFRVGDEIVIYTGDSEGAISAPWVPGVVTDVSKACRPQWVTGKGNSGCYWQVTARTREPVFSEVRELRFSTTEPRALLRAEFDHLRAARAGDPEFFRIFCANARRDWQPIWCLERGSHARTDEMNFGSWLREE